MCNTVGILYFRTHLNGSLTHDLSQLGNVIILLYGGSEVAVVLWFRGLRLAAKRTLEIEHDQYLSVGYLFTLHLVQLRLVMWRNTVRGCTAIEVLYLAKAICIKTCLTAKQIQPQPFKSPPKTLMRVNARFPSCSVSDQIFY